MQRNLSPTPYDRRLPKLGNAKRIIVVDDGSRDGTAEVARRFASRDIVFVSKENEGASATRNHSFQLSQGDYIHLDADDLLAPDKIEPFFAKATASGCFYPARGATPL
jgi:glycosyltransferase involved in cell wall biosynthesis